MADTLFPLGGPAPADYFVGEAYLHGLEDVETLTAGAVTFRPGARNNWHTHAVGQLLVVTDGVGLYQERGRQARVIRAGDTVYTAADVVHWHGATAESAMTHVAVTLKNADGEVVTWGDEVTEDEFAAANAEVSGG